MAEKKCPYCNQDMLEGFIENTACPLAWTPKGENRPFLKLHRIADYEDGLGKFVFPYGWHANAYKCDKCNIIIIDNLNKH